MIKELTFVEHLEELRRRIIVSLISVILIGAGAFPFTPGFLTILKSPASGRIGKLAYFSPPEAFLIYIKIALVVGLMLSVPVILYQVWAFISPAIESASRRHGLLFLLSSIGAFIAGASFGFLALLPTALKFFFSFSGDNLEPVISASNYISFVLGLTLGCGLVFEMPILSFLLSKMGIINYRFLRRAWKYAVIVIFIASAIVTPTPDIFNMALLALPMLLLYEVSIWVSRFSGKVSGKDHRVDGDIEVK